MLHECPGEPDRIRNGVDLVLEAAILLNSEMTYPLAVGLFQLPSHGLLYIKPPTIWMIGPDWSNLEAYVTVTGIRHGLLLVAEGADHPVGEGDEIL